MHVAPSLRWLGLALVCLVALVAPSTRADANGRFPQAINLHFRPGETTPFALQVTFGLLVTTDGGATWRWNCEEAVGFGGVYDPDYAVTSTNLVLATTTSKDGLRLTRDFCTWMRAPATLNNTFTSQVEVATDGTIYVMASDAADSQLYVSTDDGVSFAPRSNPGLAGDWWESLALASLPGPSTRLYLTGFRFVDSVKVRFFLRSDDGGQTWNTLPVDDFEFGGHGADLQIAAVSKLDPDLLYARVFHANGLSVGDHIYRSTDAGASWVRVFEATDDVTAVVLRASGEVVLATRVEGLHTSSDGITFGPAVVGAQIHCLHEAAGTLYACSNGFVPDSMAIATGTVVGEWTPAFAYAEIAGPISCAAGTTQKDVCEDMRFCFLACQLSIDEREGCPSCLSAPDAAPPDAFVVDVPRDDCCNVGGGPAGALSLSAAVALLLGLRPRSRRRQR